MFKTVMPVFQSFEFRYCFVLRISNFPFTWPLALKITLRGDHAASRHPIAKRAGARGRVICETKRIGATTFSSMAGRPPGLCPPPRCKAGPHGHTINDATMRPCGVDHPASRHPIAAGSRSHSVPPHRAYHSTSRTAISAVAAAGSCIMRVKNPSSHLPLSTEILFRLASPAAARWRDTRAGCRKTLPLCKDEPITAAGMTESFFHLDAPAAPVIYYERNRSAR